MVKKNRSKTFCVMPWVHLAGLTNGKYQLCCLASRPFDSNFQANPVKKFWNGIQMRLVRVLMLLGAKPPQCSICFSEEEMGLPSHRQIETKSWDNRIGKEAVDELLSKTSLLGGVKNYPRSLDIRFGNKCNLECIMCQPRESTRWSAKSKELSNCFESGSYLFYEWSDKSKIDRAQFDWIDDDSTWENLEAILPHLEEIIIGGGEPLLVKKHYDFIKRVATNLDVSNIELRYHTNGTIFADELVEYWGKFKKVEFFVSIDGLDAVSNYVRYPLDWSQFSENLLKYDSLGEKFGLRLLYSVNALNIGHFFEFANWVVDSEFKKIELYKGLDKFLIFGSVHWPMYLAPKVLPKKSKDRVRALIESEIKRLECHGVTAYQGLLALLTAESTFDDLENLKKYIVALDKTRQTDALSVFGELINEINEATHES